MGNIGQNSLPEIVHMGHSDKFLVHHSHDTTYQNEPLIKHSLLVANCTFFNFVEGCIRMANGHAVSSLNESDHLPRIYAYMVF